MKHACNFKDLAGLKFGKLTAISYFSKGTYRSWNCNCDCGNKKQVRSTHLQSGHTQSCGCIVRHLPPLQIGQKFGRLTILSKNLNKKWLCKCECGNKKVIHGFSLRNGDTKSCGCIKREISRTSKTEQLLGDYIENEYQIKIDRGFSIEDKVYDIRYKNILIESDGSYWHSFKDMRKNDKYKDELAKHNGFTLLRFTLNNENEVKDQWVSLIKPQLDKVFLTIW